jgi:hypothetical protein
MTHGFVLDIIAEISDNVSEKNRKSLILAFDERVGASAAYEMEEAAYSGILADSHSI